MEVVNHVIASEDFQRVTQPKTGNVWIILVQVYLVYLFGRKWY